MSESKTAICLYTSYEKFDRWVKNIRKSKTKSSWIWYNGKKYKLKAEFENEVLYLYFRVHGRMHIVYLEKTPEQIKTDCINDGCPPQLADEIVKLIVEGGATNRI